MANNTTRITIQLSQILGVDVRRASEIIDELGITELAALVVAVNNKDDATVREIVSTLDHTPAEEIVDIDNTVDKLVDECVESVNALLAGKEAKTKIMELNQQQRRMFYGQIPPVVSKVIQKTIDLTPIVIWQRHAQELGYGESALKEGAFASVHDIEKVLQSEIKRVKKYVNKK